MATANVRFSIYNWVAIGLMAVLFIVLFKLTMTKWPVPGVATVASAV